MGRQNKNKKYDMNKHLKISNRYKKNQRKTVRKGQNQFQNNHQNPMNVFIQMDL